MENIVKYNQDKGTENRSTKGENKMYEVVKVVNDYEIIRMIGTRSQYHVINRKDQHKFYTFKTIKAATKFIECEL